jgi:hypothetical protein
VDKVFVNLCLGLDRIGVCYTVNLPFCELRDDDRVGVLGRGRYSLLGYDRPNPIVAGIGLMTHPSEWPTLCTDYPVVKYLQHSKWTSSLYEPFFGDRCAIWPVGIDTAAWAPASEGKDIDVLIYDKIFWDRETYEQKMVQPILESLSRRNLCWKRLRYGSYDSSTYQALVQRSKSMLFLSAHESQGIAYQECLSCDVPVLAWDPGRCVDPNRFEWGTPEIASTSVPYFDARCGATFRGPEDLEAQLDLFLERLRRQDFQPRAYILENLTLESCSQKFLEFLDATSTSS